MNAKSLSKRVDNVLKRVGGMNFPLSLRTYTPGNKSDELIGRGRGSTTDTVISPPPAYDTMTSRQVIYLNSAGKKANAGDYLITLSASSITEDVLLSPNTQFVIKDGSSETVLRIIDYDGKGFQGVTVAWIVIARRVSNDG